MKSIKIYFITAEISPFAETCALSDISRRVPIILNEEKHDIRLIMPKYGFISERKFILREVIRLKEIEVDMGGEKVITSIKSAFIPNTKVQVYFLDYPEYFKDCSHFLYRGSADKSYYSDNDRRFILFSKAALQALKYLYWQPDIIHCNDWHTGLIPLFLKQLSEEDPFFKNIHTLFSISSLNRQVQFTMDSLKYAGLDKNIREKLNTELDIKEDRFSSFVPVQLGIMFSELFVTIDRENSKISTQLNKHGSLTRLIDSRRSKYFQLQLKGMENTAWKELAHNFIELYEKLIEFKT